MRIVGRSPLRCTHNAMLPNVDFIRTVMLALRIQMLVVFEIGRACDRLTFIVACTPAAGSKRTLSASRMNAPADAGARAEA